MAQYWGREEGQGNHFSSPGECLQPVTTQKQSMFANKDRLGGKGEKKCLLPPKGTFFPQHESGSQTRNADPSWGLGCVWRRNINWRVKIAAVQGSFAPLTPKAPLFYPASFTHTQTDTHKHAHIPTHSHQLQKHRDFPVSLNLHFETVKWYSSYNNDVDL